MSRLTLALLPLLALTVSTASAQSRDADSSRNSRDPEYWNRFEQEFNTFISRAVDGFKDPADFDAPLDASPDSLRFAANTDSARSDGGWSSDGDHYRWSWSSSDRGSAKYARFGIPRNVSWIDERTRPSEALLRYNRVEGHFLGLGTEKKYYWTDGREFTPYGSLGYAFRAHRWWGDLALARQIPLGDRSDQLLEFGVGGYVSPDSKDKWLIGHGENSAAAFFLHEDFRDHYERRGVSLHGAYYLRGRDLFAEASLTYLAERNESLEEHTDWALFGGSKTFRPNPLIDSGNLRSWLARLGYSTMTGKMRTGWDMSATAEFSGREFRGDFNFQQFILDVRRHQPLGRYDKVSTRLRLGTAHGELPAQRTFELGGLGSLPGYRFKELSGDSLGANRMLLFNVEYMINGDALHDLDFWPSFIFRHVNLLFIADAGLIRRMNPSWSPLAGFGGITWNELRTDVGVGLAGENGTWRIGAAWRTDHSAPARLFLRAAVPF